MKARMNHPVMILPEAMKALHALNVATDEGGMPASTRELVHLRASQINGCRVCVEMHARDLKRMGETDERLFAVGAWRDAPYFVVGRCQRCQRYGASPTPAAAEGPTFARPCRQRETGRLSGGGMY